MILVLVFPAVVVCWSLCDHIMDTLNKMDILNICFNKLSAGIDIVVSMLLLLCDFSEPFPFLFVEQLLYRLFPPVHNRLYFEATQTTRLPFSGDLRKRWRFYISASLRTSRNCNFLNKIPENTQHILLELIIIQIWKSISGPLTENSSNALAIHILKTIFQPDLSNIYHRCVQPAQHPSKEI